MEAEGTSRIRSQPVDRLAPFLVGLAVAALAAFLHLSPYGRELDDRLLDAFYLLRPDQPAPPGVVVVAIDEPSIQELRLAWPWPRRVHAALVDRLTSLGARLIVMDVVFAEPSNPADDQAFERAMAASGRVILASTIDKVDDPGFTRTMLIEPYPPFKTAALDTGLAMLTPDPDGAVRRFKPLLSGRATLPGAAFSRLSGQGLSAAGLIDFPGPPRTIRTLSYVQVLDEAAPLPRSLIEGKTVFVGRSLTATPVFGPQADLFRTPYSLSGGLPTAGVELHATILATLESGRIGREAPASAVILVIALLTPLSCLAFSRMRPLAGAAASVGVCGGVIAGSYLLFRQSFVWFPPLLPAVAVLAGETAQLLAGYMRAYRERRQIRHAFSRYVSPTVVDRLLARPELLEPGGEEVDATVLFSDLAGFTSFSERMAPGELMTVLSDYFSPMTAIIKQNSGTLDKFIGDAIMAFWGAPAPVEDHAACACRAAAQMGKALEDLRRRWEGRDYPDLHARIGIHTGRLVAGNVGSREQVNYTCLGDTVNLASRLEGVNKYYGTSIMISGDTRDRLGPEFAVRLVDYIRVKGRAEPVPVYELLGVGESAPTWAAEYEKGLLFYKDGDFDRALGVFSGVLTQRPDDGPAATLIRRCQKYLESPPPPGWDGVHVMESK